MPRRRTDFAPVPAGDLPDGLIVFDGVCVLCSGWVRFVLPRDAEGRFRFASIQGSYGRAVSERLGIDPADPQTNAVVRDGLVYFKSDSALAVLGALPGWRWTRVLRLVPKGLRDWAYDRVARNRYRLFGRTDACMVPSRDGIDRFFS